MKAVSTTGLMLALMIAPAIAQTSSTTQREAALAFERQGNIAEAEAAWRAYSKAHPSNPEPYAHLGFLESRQEHYKEAIPLYRKALAINPNVPGLRLDLALALFKAEQLKEAIPQFTILLKSAPPDSPEAQRCAILLGMSYYGLAQYSAAVPLLKKAADRDKQNLPLRLALAHSCLWSKQTQCVLDVYREILDLNAESAEADMLAGEALDEENDHDGAVKMFRAAAVANPKEPNVHFGLGYLLWTQKQYPEAISEFKAELANDPNHAQSLAYLGDSLVQVNNHADARAPLARSITLDPKLWIANRDLGIIDAEAGRNDQALSELKKAAQLKPDEVSIHWHLARLLRKMGRTEEAKVEFDAAQKLNKAADEDLYRKIANNGQKQHTQQSSETTGSSPQ